MTKKTILIALLALVFAAPVIAAEKPTPAPKKPDFSMPKLKIESVEELFIGNVRDISKSLGAKYIAWFTLDPSGNILVFRRSERISYYRDGKGFSDRISCINNISEIILSTPTGKKLSSKQKEFLSRGYAIIRPRTNQKISPIYILGVDEEQARNTAIAFIEYLTESAKIKYRDAEKRLQDREKQHQELSKEGEGYPGKIKAAKEKFDKIKRQTHYQDVEAASKAIDRMNMIIESEVIKQSVLDAKERVLATAFDTEEAIKETTSPEKYDRQPIVRKLEELRIDLKIDFAEVMATLKTAGKIRTDAELYIKYQRELHIITIAYYDIRDKTEKAHKSLLSQKKKIANPPKEMLPPKVIDNKVVLGPVTVEHDGNQEYGHEEDGY